MLPGSRIGRPAPQGARDRQKSHDHTVRSGQNDRHPAADPEIPAVLHGQPPVNGHHPRECKGREDKLKEPHRRTDGPRTHHHLPARQRST